MPLQTSKTCQLRKRRPRPLHRQLLRRVPVRPLSESYRLRLRCRGRLQASRSRVRTRRTQTPRSPPLERDRSTSYHRRQRSLSLLLGHRPERRWNLRLRLLRLLPRSPFRYLRGDTRQSRHLQIQASRSKTVRHPVTAKRIGLCQFLRGQWYNPPPGLLCNFPLSQDMKLARS